MPKGIYDHSNNKGTGGQHWQISDTSKMKGRHPKSEFKKGLIPWNKGIEYLVTSDVNNWQWKGDDVGYSALHIGRSDRKLYFDNNGRGRRVILNSKQHR